MRTKPVIAFSFLVLGLVSSNVIFNNENEVTLNSAFDDNDDNGRIDTGEDGNCRRCLCGVNTCPDGIYARCLQAGPLCCCCLPATYPCLNMDEYMSPPAGSNDDTLEALEEGIEDIGRLEKK